MCVQTFCVIFYFPTVIHTYIRIIIYTRIPRRILARNPICIPMRIENDLRVFGLMLFRFRFAVASMPNRVEWMMFWINDCCSVPRRRSVSPPVTAAFNIEYLAPVKSGVGRGVGCGLLTK